VFLPEVAAVKKILLLAPALAVILLALGCATGVTTTTSPATSPATTNAPTTTTAGSSSTAAPTTSALATTFTAELSGAEVVPAVDTLATGSATFTIDATGTRGYFKLTVSNIAGVIAARVHEGKPGTNGQGLLILYPGPTQSGTFTGVLAQGNFNASVLIGSLTGKKTLAEFAVLLQGGLAYVNVGTTQNPQGEIRGQIH
jgi:ABC-type phosphate transport system substrate-binding protein